MINVIMIIIIHFIIIIIIIIIVKYVKVEKHMAQKWHIWIILKRHSEAKLEGLHFSTADEFSKITSEDKKKLKEQPNKTQNKSHEI